MPIIETFSEIAVASTITIVQLLFLAFILGGLVIATIIWIVEITGSKARRRREQQHRNKQRRARLQRVIHG